ncbi:unnamed protein product [Choristocarpus tenellus]
MATNATCNADLDTQEAMDFTAKRLAGDGFVVFPIAVPAEDVALIREQVDRKGFLKKTRNIFNPNSKRKLGPITEMKRSEVRGKVEDIISSCLVLRLGVEAQLVPDKASILISEPNCARQFAHRDYPKRNTIEHAPIGSAIRTGVGSSSRGRFPVSGIMALQSGTRFGVWKHSHDMDEVFNDELHVVTLQPGDILLFHGSLVHCGMDYSARNVRVHWYTKGAGGRSSSASIMPPSANGVGTTIFIDEYMSRTERIRFHPGWELGEGQVSVEGVCRRSKRLRNSKTSKR